MVTMFWKRPFGRTNTLGRHKRRPQVDQGLHVAKISLAPHEQ